jgi:hypothetical protein
MSAMGAVRRFLRWVVAPLYHWLAGPAYRRIRQDLELDTVRRELQEARAAFARMNRLYLDYHAALSQQVADELAAMSRRLDELCQPKQQRAA